MVWTTGTLPEGGSRVRVRYIDDAGNVGTWSNAAIVRRDRTAPAAPAVEAISSWITADRGTVRWVSPAEAGGRAPLAAIDLRVCGPNAVCGDTRTSAVATDADVDALTDGDTVVRVRYLDLAGNEGAWSAP